MEQDAKFYSSLGANYEDAFGHDPGLLQFLQMALTYLPPHAHVLDIGCGTGKPVATTLTAAGHSVTGLDFSADMVALSQKAVPSGQFEQVDMRHYEPADGTRFDAVFNILSLFALGREDIEGMAARWGRWVPQDGILCVGSVAAEDCEPETRGQGYDEDGRCARNIRFRFMATDIKIDLMTTVGWEKLLHENGFEIVDTMKDHFVPPKASESDDEVHYFIVARKVR